MLGRWLVKTPSHFRTFWVLLFRSVFSSISRARLWEKWRNSNALTYVRSRVIIFDPDGFY